MSINRPIREEKTLQKCDNQHRLQPKSLPISECVRLQFSRFQNMPFSVIVFVCISINQRKNKFDLLNLETALIGDS